MSADLEETYECIFEARVPSMWAKVSIETLKVYKYIKFDWQAYPSLKPLGSWTRDLVLRVEQFAKWAELARPPTLFWMSGFTFPTGFLTAVLQTSARANSVS